MLKYTVEVTDTFAGEANYSWVRRYSFEAPDDATDLQIIRRAKKMAGWNGYPCTTENMGDMFTLRPKDGSCVIMFITY